MRLAAFLVVGGCAVAAHAQWTVVNLQNPAWVQAQAQGVGGGQQVGWVQTGGTVASIRASLWSGSAGSWVNLHPASAVYSFANAADGEQQVGEAFFGAPSHASLWTGTAASWVDLNPAGVTDSAAFDVDAGTQVGRALVLGYHASLWTGTAASWVDLNPPPTLGYGHASEAYAISGNRVVGYVVDVGGVMSASLWVGGGAWINLHPPGNISSQAFGVDAAQVVGEVRVPDTSSHAALWTGGAGTWVDLYPGATVNSRATDVAGGQQVGYAQVGGWFHASLWTGTAASRVDLHSFLPATFLTSQAESIWTSAGVTYVAGHGYNTQTNREEALLWTRGMVCRPDLTTTAVAGTPGYGVPDGILNTNDFFYYLAQFAAGNLAVADLTASAVAGTPGYGVPNGVLSNDDFFFYLVLYAAGC
ncbi:MAG: GC-type dockerin domain-anchored protein [Phycisphaerales bacterium]